MIILSIIAIIFGLIYIFKKDWAWKIQRWQTISLRAKERPESWETSSTFWGVVIIVIGILIFLTSH